MWRPVVGFVVLVLASSCGGGKAGGAGGAAGTTTGTAGTASAGTGATGGGGAAGALGGAIAGAAGGGAGTIGAGGSAGVIAGHGGSGAAPGGAAGTMWIDLDAGADAYVSDGPASGAQFQSFCAGVRATMVARNERCYGFTHAQAEAWVNIDPCAAWGSALDTNHMAFDATNADACVAALQALSCGVTHPPGACDGVLRGLVPNGGPGTPGDRCALGRQLAIGGEPLPNRSIARTTPVTSSLFTECMPGSFCAPFAGTRPFMCTPYPSTGEACVSRTGGCITGVCDHTGHCAAPKQEGDGCTDSDDCVEGTFCGPGSTCTAQHASGPCASDGECLLPSICRSGACTIVRAGDACAHSCTFGDSGGCAQGTYCGVDSTCHVSPIVGQACSAASCAGDAVACFIGGCDTAAGVCKYVATWADCSAAGTTPPSCGPNSVCAKYGADGLAPIECIPPWY